MRCKISAGRSRNATNSTALKEDGEEDVGEDEGEEERNRIIMVTC